MREIMSAIKSAEYTNGVAWGDVVTFIMDMHREKFDVSSITEDVNHAEEMYKKKLLLGSMRTLQWQRGILQHELRSYNCAATPIDRLRVFQEMMYVLLCGAGAGYSLLPRFINKIPPFMPRTGEKIVYTVLDSIEGWSTSIGVLIDSYANPASVYFQKQVVFDYSQIRPKGALIAGRFKAPGPSALVLCHERMVTLIDARLKESVYLRAIDYHELICMIADAVISGGVRRSALIALFDPSDVEMKACKTGNWYETKPYLARANNSGVFVRGQYTREDVREFEQYVKDFGEPGYIFVDSPYHLTNPLCA